MKIIAYTRVSTAEQRDSGLGLDAQRHAILREAKARGWAEADIDWVEDAGFSAKSLKRPGLAMALEALRRGDASVLVVAKTDRLSRSLLDFAGILQRAQRQGWALLALDSPADLTTAQGEAMASVMAVFAQLERRLIGERTSAAMAAARERGITLGRPRLLPEDVAVRIAAERESGASFRAIADGLNADGVPTAQGGQQWYAATVRKVLLSRASRQAAQPTGTE
jgi:DNA invertase Pin-like site-specific DNA recombinase